LPTAGADETTPLWRISTIDDVGNVGQYCSLEVAENGTYYISYFDASNGHLKYATNESGTPTTTTLDTWANTGQYTSLYLDEKGKVHISYEGVNGQYLFYLNNMNGAWVRTAITMNSMTNNFTSIAGRGDGKVYVVYYSGAQQDYYYGCNSKGYWENHFVYKNANVGTFASLAVDRQGRDYSTFYDATNGDLLYNYNLGDNTEVVDRDGDVGQYTSIAYDSRLDPQPFISYYDVTNSSLKMTYKRWDASPTNPWSKYVIDNADDVGKFSSIRVDATSKAHIAYYDASNDNLKYAEWKGGVSQASVVDFEGDVGQYASLSLDSHGAPSIAYYDASNGDLKLATMIGEGEAPLPNYVPDAPTGMTAALMGNNTVQLTWVPAPLGPGQTPTLGYHLFSGVGLGLPSRVLTLGNVTTYLDPDLEYATNFEYWVSAFNSFGEGNASAIVNITTNAAPPLLSYVAPAPLLNPNPTAGYTTISLGWAAPPLNSTTPQITGYKIYRGPSPDAMVLIASPGNFTSYSDSGLRIGTQYYYAVSAVNSAGEGSRSVEISVTTGTPPATPAPQAPFDMTWIIIGAMAILAVLGAVVLLRKRK
jgi:hypothetical protein